MSSLRVVLVDDFAAVRQLLGLLVGQAGHEVVGEAADGRAGVAVALAYSPDLVIMDWQMPELDGVRATRRILERAPTMRVIAFSSANNPAVGDAFMAAGASPTTTRPTSPDSRPQSHGSLNSCDVALASLEEPRDQVLAGPRSRGRARRAL